jgi:hypothetical protein
MAEDTRVRANVDIVLGNLRKGAQQRGVATFTPISAAEIATKVMVRMGQAVTANAVEEILQSYEQQGKVRLTQRADGSRAVTEISAGSLGGEHLQRKGKRGGGKKGKGRHQRRRNVDGDTPVTGNLP